MRKGFTLVELLIVLAVIAALMAVATPVALNAVKAAKGSQVAQNMRNILQAAVNYINVEHLTTSDNNLLTTLQSKNYLSGNIGSGYRASATLSGSEFTVTVEYTGTDVEVKYIQAAWSEVDNNKTVTAKVQKWW